MSMINASDRWFYLDADGEVVEGDEGSPPGASTLLVAPGGSIDEATARVHGIDGRLSSLADVTFTNPATEEEYVHVAGRAVAPHLSGSIPRSQMVAPRRSHLAAPKTDTPRRGTVAGEEKAVSGPTAEIKSVERAPENKAGMSGPLSATQPKK